MQQLTDSSLPDDLVDVTAAAKRARCHIGTVHRWIRRGRVRGWKRCGRWFVSEAELLALFTPRAAPARAAPAEPIAPTAHLERARAEWAEATLRQLGFKK